MDSRYKKGGNTNIYKGISSLYNTYRESSRILDFSSPSTASRFGWTRSGAGTMENSGGDVVYGAHNLLSRSNDFGNAAWIKNGVTVSGSTVTASGTNVNAVYREFGALLPLGLCSTAIVARAGSKSFIQFGANFGLTGFSDTRANFNVATGVLGTVDAGLTATIDAIGDGWYLCAVRWTRQGASGGNGVWSMQDSGTAAREANSTAGTIDVADARLNLGPLTDYIPTTTSPVYLMRTPDYTHGVPGLLLEGARTNLGFAHNTADPASIVKNDVSWVGINSGNTVGGLSCHEYSINGSTSPHCVYGQNYSISSGAAFVASVFVPSSGRRYFGLRGSDTSGGLPWIVLDTTTGATAINAAAVNGGAYAVAGGWRLWLSFVSSSTTGNWVFAALTSFAAPSTGEGLGEVFAGSGLVALAGWTFEPGAYPTSYIPNPTTGTMTRVADVAEIGPGDEFDALFGPIQSASAGTIIVEFYYRGVDNINQRGLVTGPLGKYLLYISDTINAIGSFDGASYIQTDSLSPGIVKVALSLDATTRDIVSNGGTVNSGAHNGTLIFVPSLWIGAITGTSGTLNSTVSKITFIPRRITGAALQALTA